jgi:O-antigen/teichoic acid export membrane protein
MSIKKNIVYNVALNSLNIFFPIISAPYISRVLGVTNIGLVNFALNYVGYFILFAGFGINTYGILEIAKCRENKEKTSEVFSSIIFINIISDAAVSLCYIVSIFLIPVLREASLLFIVVGISLYVSPLTIDWYFSGREDFKIITYRSFIIKCVSFCCLFIFVKRQNDIIPYLILNVFSTVAANVWNLIYVLKKGIRLTWKNLCLLRHVRALIIFFFTNVVINIYTAIDTLMLGLLTTYEQVGYYTSPNKILIALVRGLGSISTALLPRFSYNNANNNAMSNGILYQKTLDLNLLLSIPLAAGLFLISGRFVPFFFGAGFEGSVVPMETLSLKTIPILLASFVVNILISTGHQKKVLASLAAAALFSFLLNMALIPRYGATGAAITSTATETLVAVLSLGCLYKFTSVRLSWKIAGSSVLFTLPFFPLRKIAGGMRINSFYFLLIFICSAIACYVALQIIFRNYLFLQIVDSIKKRRKVRSKT